MERELRVGVAGAGFAGAVRAANRLGLELDACPAHEPMEVAP
jgi:hypothetical protein